MTFFYETIALIVIAIVIVALPSRWDPAILFKEWMDRLSGD